MKGFKITKIKEVVREEIDLGKMFAFLCVGVSKSDTANSIGIHKTTLGLKLKQFKESDVKHIDIIIKELRKYKDSLK